MPEWIKGVSSSNTRTRKDAIKWITRPVFVRLAEEDLLIRCSQSRYKDVRLGALWALGLKTAWGVSTKVHSALAKAYQDKDKQIRARVVPSGSPL